MEVWSILGVKHLGSWLRHGKESLEPCGAETRLMVFRALEAEMCLQVYVWWWGCWQKTNRKTARWTRIRVWIFIAWCLQASSIIVRYLRVAIVGSTRGRRRRRKKEKKRKDNKKKTKNKRSTKNILCLICVYLLLTPAGEGVCWALWRGNTVDGLPRAWATKSKLVCKYLLGMVAWKKSMHDLLFFESRKAEWRYGLSLV